MPPVLDHLALGVAARMIGYHRLAQPQPHAEGVGLERQPPIDMLDRHVRQDGIANRRLVGTCQ